MIVPTSKISQMYNINIMYSDCDCVGTAMTKYFLVHVYNFKVLTFQLPFSYL